MSDLFHVEIIMGNTAVRLDLYGEVHASRFATFLDRDTAMALSKQLGKAALLLPESKPEDFA